MSHCHSFFSGNLLFLGRLPRGDFPVQSFFVDRGGVGYPEGQASEDI